MNNPTTDAGSQPVGGSQTQSPSHPVPFVIALASTGIGAGAWLVGSPGPGIFVPFLALLGAATLALAGGTRLDSWSLGFSALALALLSTAAFRAAVWLVVPTILFALCLAALAVGGGTSWAQLTDSVMAPVLRLPAAPRFLRGVVGPSAHSLKAKSSVRLAGGLAVGAVLVFVFGVLFSSADPVFEMIVLDLVPSWDLGLLPARGVVVFLAIVATAGFAVALRLGRLKFVEAILGQSRGLITAKAGRIEWLTALGLLDALLAAFVMVQLVVLFGGRRYVLKTAGLTYAQYARQGFAQLIAVAALTLAVVAVFWTCSARKSKRDEVVFRTLLTILCALTLVVLASALRRLGLYEEAFGFTRSRIAAHGLILLLGATLSAVLVGAAAGRVESLPKALVLLAGAALFFFSVANPDAVVARHNLERYHAIGKIDLQYLSTLSSDAVPVLVRLSPAHREQVLSRISRELSQPEPWSSANISRAKARSLLR